MRRLLVILAIAGAVSTGSSVNVLVAARIGDCEPSLNSGAIECEGIGIVQIDVPDRDVGPASAPAQTIPHEPYTVIGNDPGTNEPCRGVAYRPEGSALDPVAMAGRFARSAAVEALAADLPDCPAAESSAADVSTPQGYAVQYWNQIPLPNPDPYIAPGRAITGMYAYLETRGSTTHTFTEPDTPFGTLTIVANGAYYVDWGDGTETGPHPYEGEPWPDGRIRHEYLRVGSYDVVVTERWTATWSFGSESGTLDELRTVGRIEDFPVEQIQAVRLR